MLTNLVIGTTECLGKVFYKGWSEIVRKEVDQSMDYTREIRRELKEALVKRYHELEKQLTKIAIKDTIAMSVPKTGVSGVGGIVTAFTKFLLKIATRPVEITSGLAHVVEYADYKDKDDVGNSCLQSMFGAVFGGPPGLPLGCWLELMGGYLHGEMGITGNFFC